MEIVISKNQLYCSRHSQKAISYFKVNETLESKQQDLFQCSECFNEDVDFKGVNYLSIDQIMEYQDSTILMKWPPLNDYSILSQLKQEIQKNKNNPSVVQQISNFYSNLKKEIIDRIDRSEKTMINRVLDQPLDSNQIIKQYQDISKIKELQTLLTDLKQTSIEQESSTFSSFINKIELQKEQNTELLQTLLKQFKTKQNLITFEAPNLMRQDILGLIERIDFFTQDAQNNQEKNHSDQIFGLISNKTNFFSSLSEEQVLDVYNLLRKGKEMTQNNSISNSQTYQLLQTYKKENSYHNEDMERICSIFPIFDLDKINILSKMNMQKTNVYDGLQRAVITKKDNDQIELSISHDNYKGEYKNYYTNICTDFNLLRDKKYIFRIKMQNPQNTKISLTFGLIEAEKANNKQGHFSQLACNFLSKDNIYVKNKSVNYGVDKQIKDEGMTLSKDNVVEMRVCLDEKLLEILDYPNYQYKFGIVDDNIQLLEIDHKLFIGVFQENVKIIIQEAMIVDYFEN